MTDDFSKIDRLVSDFEAGLSVDSLLAEVNADESLMFNWGHDHFNDHDYSFLTHEREIFVLEDSLDEYFDLDELRKVRDGQVAQFIYDRIENSFDGEVCALHFFETSASVISARSDIRGQGGYWYIDLDITSDRTDRFKKLFNAGYLFLPNEGYAISENSLIEKYQKFIRNRLPGGS